MSCARACAGSLLRESEVSELVGAGYGERAPEDRMTHRNGYRARTWSTRAGEIELAIPKIRRGSYFPSFLEPRRRSEQAGFDEHLVKPADLETIERVCQDAMELIALARTANS